MVPCNHNGFMKTHAFRIHDLHESCFQKSESMSSHQINTFNEFIIVILVLFRYRNLTMLEF